MRAEPVDPTPTTAVVLAELVARADVAAPHELAELIDESATSLGARGATAYLADLQQHLLMPFVAPDERPLDNAPLNIDATLAGRTFQTFEPTVQEQPPDGLRLWLPLLVGSDRIGVLGVLLPHDDAAVPTSAQVTGMSLLAATAATLLAAKTPYGDTLVRLRRRDQIGIAAEIQYGLLPPLGFAGRSVSIAAALEPCYNVAGDTIDYAVDPGVARFGVFDGMGHGLHSAQCAVLTVAAYRNARRAQGSLSDTLRSIDDALCEGLGGEVFTTAVLAELDTASGHLRWVNAGHPEPLLLRGGRMVKTLAVEPRPPLGLGSLVGGDEVVVGSEQLEPGDALLLYTDGVVEARSVDGDFFGLPRLLDLVIRHLAGGLPAVETVRRVVKELLDHQRGQLSDDASLLLVQWPGSVPDA